MTCPCIDCLTLAVCKQKVMNGDIFDLLSLVDSCTLYREFLKFCGNMDIVEKSLHTTLLKDTNCTTDWVAKS